ncbi:MAG: glucose dehydrogenase [Acidimicrobiaceae bacterium]|jgi:4-hydroxy-tetrahydrodipicolinate synthase|nr:glucose dehydrogenase [Acidimicrobiaceae bacterium]
MVDPSSVATQIPTEAAPRARWLRGIVPPVCTPLTEGRDIDTVSLERFVGFLIEGGVNGLFILGSSSESAFLRDDQRDTVVEVAVKTAAGQVPVLAGAIDMTTERIIDHARRALDRGVDAIVATAPFYARATHPAEIDLHFRSIKAACSAPLVAYDIPVAVHTKLDPTAVLALAADGIIDGLKDSSGDLGAMREVIMGARALPDFAVMTGSEVVVDCVMLMGADGAVPGLGNVDPHGYVELFNSCRSGEWDQARRQQDRLVRLFEITRCADPSKKGPSSSGLGGFKTALMLRGVIATNAMALPQIALDEVEIARVREVLLSAGLL